MAKTINAATCSDCYDFVLTDSGEISVETNTTSSLANILKLDFNSNDDWALDYELGLPWIRSSNDGLLQVKGSEAMMIALIQRKLMATDGVKTVKEIEMKRGLNRAVFLKITVISDDGQEIILERKM